MMRAALLALLALLATAFAAGAEDIPRSLSIGGIARSYYVHLPHGVKPVKPAPLVVVFHGGGGNAANAGRMSGMSAKADREHFIVAYPNGSGRLGHTLLTWNTWVCCGYALDSRADDVAFVRAMVEAIERDYAVDRSRVYATGLSNGGMMTYRVGCELADVFAAIAPVAGALNTGDCRPASPLSVIVFHGTADRHILFDGGKPRTNADRHQRLDNPVSFAVGFWSGRDGCAGTPTREQQGHVIHETYSCPEGLAVELYAIEGQGHAWPGGEKGMRFGNVDSPTSEISATELMWEFFMRHPKS